MRTYPCNSPQAAARVVTLALLADGHLSGTELDALDRSGARQRLGVPPEALLEVVRGFCEDMLSTSGDAWGAASSMHPHVLAALLAEVEDPVLRVQILGLCADVILADRHVSDGESAFLAAMATQWFAPRDARGASAAGRTPAAFHG